MPPRAEIITVGTELLLGEIVDTNAAHLSRRLADLGIDVYHRTTVGDNWTRFTTALGQALQRADIIFITGGLGPTDDDLTRSVVAAVTGRKIQMNEEALQHIEEYFRVTGRVMSANNRRQAMFPEGAEALFNGEGTAPGIWLEHDNRLIVCLPGPPTELRPMFEQQIIPRLRARFGGRESLITRVLRFAGIGEAALAEALEDLIAAQVDPTLALYAGRGEVRLRLATRAKSREEAERRFAPIEEEIRKRVGSHLYGFDDDTLEGTVGKLLQANGASLAVAESCTGGFLGHRLTNVPGSSRYFVGGVIAYANEIKTGQLNVSADVIERHGAVSAAVAEAMARGIRNRFGSTYGIAVTGIAGPDGGTEEKPVGTVYIGWAGPDGCDVQRFLFPTNRENFKIRTTTAALDGLRRRLQGLLPWNANDRE